MWVGWGFTPTQLISSLLSINDCNDLFQAKRLDEDRVGTVEVAGRHKGSRHRSVDGGTNLGRLLTCLNTTLVNPTLSRRKGCLCS